MQIRIAFVSLDSKSAVLKKDETSDRPANKMESYIVDKPSPNTQNKKGLNTHLAQTNAAITLPSGKNNRNNFPMNKTPKKYGERKNSRCCPSTSTRIEHVTTKKEMPLTQTSTKNGVFKDLRLPILSNVNKQKKYKIQWSNGVSAENRCGGRWEAPQEQLKQIQDKKYERQKILDIRENFTEHDKDHKEHIADVGRSSEKRYDTKTPEIDSINGKLTPMVQDSTSKRYNELFLKMDNHDKKELVSEENWAETLKSCRYLRKPRGQETPAILIESIFQDD